MTRTARANGHLTRRGILRGAGAVLITGSLAGCADDDREDDSGEDGGGGGGYAIDNPTDSKGELSKAN